MGITLYFPNYEGVQNVHPLEIYFMFFMQKISLFNMSKDYNHCSFPDSWTVP